MLKIMNEGLCYYFVDRLINDLEKKLLSEEHLVSFLEVPLIDGLRNYVQDKHKKVLISVTKNNNYFSNEKRLALGLLRKIQDNDLTDKLWTLFYDPDIGFSVKIAILYTVMHKKTFSEQEMAKIFDELNKHKENYIGQCIKYYGGSYGIAVDTIRKRLESEEHINKRVLYIHSLGLFSEEKTKAKELLIGLNLSDKFESQVRDEAIKALS